MYKPWTCRKCGAPMYGPNDHETTAGCAVAWPPTITTGDTSGYVPSGPIIRGSEEARRLSRYDEAVRLINELRDVLLNFHAMVEGECPSILEDDHHDDMARAAVAKACDFLAAEPEGEEGGR